MLIHKNGIEYLKKEIKNILGTYNYDVRKDGTIAIVDMYRFVIPKIKDLLKNTKPWLIKTTDELRNDENELQKIITNFKSINISTNVLKEIEHREKKYYTYTHEILEIYEFFEKICSLSEEEVQRQLNTIQKEFYNNMMRFEKIVQDLSQISEEMARMIKFRVEHDNEELKYLRIEEQLFDDDFKRNVVSWL